MRVIIKAGLRVYLVFNFLSTVTYTVSGLANTLRFNQGLLALLVYLGSFAVITAVLTLVWWKTDAVTRFLAGSLDDQQLVVNTSNDDLFRTVIRILGLVLVVAALSSLAGTVAYDFFSRSSEFRDNAGLTRQYVTGGIQILVGAVLLIGHAQIVKRLGAAWEKGP